MINYNDEPVHYCKACTSLHIVTHGEDDICGNCGAMNFTAVVPIEDYLNITYGERKTNV